MVKIRDIYFPYARYETIGKKERNYSFTRPTKTRPHERGGGLAWSFLFKNESVYLLKSESGSAGFFIRRLTISRGNPLSREPIATVRQTCLPLPCTRSSPVGLNRVSSSGLPVDIQLSARWKNVDQEDDETYQGYIFRMCCVARARASLPSPCIYMCNSKE